MVEFAESSYRFQVQPKKWIRDRPRQLEADLVASVFPEDAETLDSIGRNPLRDSTILASLHRRHPLRRGVKSDVCLRFSKSDYRSEITRERPPGARSATMLWTEFVIFQYVSRYYRSRNLFL
ncbi:hypothetical protein B296_00011304 [Ensete ventricosum]|uniref:Uncharacterized protein n=1 Tax=Ensete ventricosum TaxID=4639 RepID=A0A426Z8R9_ENSVE|nr:hypothetical protein B296_00011304 [Ensete ventricosum]